MFQISFSSKNSVLWFNIQYDLMTFNMDLEHNNDFNHKLVFLHFHMKPFFKNWLLHLKYKVSQKTRQLEKHIKFEQAMVK